MVLDTLRVGRGRCHGDLSSTCSQKECTPPPSVLNIRVAQHHLFMVQALRALFLTIAAVYSVDITAQCTALWESTDTTGARFHYFAADSTGV